MGETQLQMENLSYRGQALYSDRVEKQVACSSALLVKPCSGRQNG